MIAVCPLSMAESVHFPRSSSRSLSYWIFPRQLLPVALLPSYSILRALPCPLRSAQPDSMLRALRCPVHSSVGLDAPCTPVPCALLGTSSMTASFLYTQITIALVFQV